MERTKVLRILRRGRKWFERPNSTVRDWSNFVERNREGIICRKCILGALGWREREPIPDDLLRLICQARPEGDRRVFSDRYSRREALAIYDKAIELAKAGR